MGGRQRTSIFFDVEKKSRTVKKEKKARKGK